MQKTNLEQNYLAGYHARWEEALCRAYSHAKESNTEVTYEQRKSIVDEAIRAMRGTAQDIVCCDYCQEQIAECMLNGKDYFEQSIGVRAQLESYGIKIKTRPSKGV